MQGVLTFRAPVVFWFPARLLLWKFVLRYAEALSADDLSSSKPFCDSVVYCAETDPDPISETTPVVLSVPDTAVEAGSARANIEANDSLQVLLQHGKRQSVEMGAAGSVVACVETGAPIPCLTDIAGGGEDDLGDLDDKQVADCCS